MYFEDEKALGEFIMIAGYYHFKLKRFEAKNATIQLEHQDGTTLTITKFGIILLCHANSCHKAKI